MQKAVDAVPLSPHENNKIAACFFGFSTKTSESELFFQTAPNSYPSELKELVKSGQRFGKRSGYIHAEVNAILKQKNGWKEAAIAITDPPCPNCMKHIAAAGIKEVFIDHKGFDKDFFRRRENEFQILSLAIAKENEIKITKVFRKENSFKVIYCPKEKEFSAPQKTEKNCSLTAQNDQGKVFSITSNELSFSKKKREALLSNPLLSGRFNLNNSALVSAVFEAKRKGLTIQKESLALNYKPVPADLIFMIKNQFKKVLIKTDQETVHLNFDGLVTELKKFFQEEN